MSVFRHHSYRRRGAIGVAVVLALVAGQQAPASAVPNDEHYAEQLVKKVDGKNVKKHLDALQAIANASGGTRAAGTTGYDRSVAYVALQLRAAGYKVTLDPANFVESWTENSPPTLAVTGGQTYVPNEQFFTFQPSPSGDVTAQIQAVDLVLPPTPTPTSTSGCETSDFAGFVAGRIALVQRGTCPFITKVQNARDAGAAAIIVFNEGQPGRTDAEPLDLGEWRLGIPMVYADFSIGTELAASPGAVVHLKVDANLQLSTDYNVIAETTKGDPNNVVMVGAHLDSVPEGPGINDNGSGAAAILETALQLAKVPVKNKVRFAFWAAEELGLLGSDQYVAKLSAPDRDRIRLYLNFDMIASPNFAYKLYDGDDSDAVGAPAGPAGSAQIENRLETFFNSRGLGHVGTDFDGRSDYGPFIAAGIPAGGIFTGAEGEKTPEEATLFGGTPGVAYDICYHQACDTLANVNATALDVNSDAIADSTARYAFNVATIPD
ncbi:M28 family metallopeptidase [Kribbella sp. NBC_00889]|uniref:M28 family metallopeptidase n=1 Tax=Kribbella sp. NBC_00889 TaxID=2975974 RepID=UPI003867BA14|nr:M28 family metallopeptidase [Kribbella sp. NBC_00889]